MNLNYLINRIFKINASTWLDVAQEVFEFQKRNNSVFSNWCNQFKIPEAEFTFLPINFFKTHKICSTDFNGQEIFESSGTTTSINSKHFIKDVELYKKSFTTNFIKQYGNIEDYCIIGLLPSYLERGKSSLVYMVNELVKQSKHEKSRFYLYEYEKLNETLLSLEQTNQKTVLIGVTYALLDFAEQYKTPLKNTIVIETGGMKGRKEELTKQEVHHILKLNFGLTEIHSEYGMTELLSQAYSSKDDKYFCPPWMKVFVRKEDDPLEIKTVGKGIINIIDLANLYSCSFIATDDVGEVFEDGSFSIYGRLDNSDLRGCSLMLQNL